MVVPNVGALFRALATAAAGLLAASCLLLVSPETYGDRCKFAGEDSACGRCLRDRCQVMIDECCKDDSCGPALAVLEGCASHGGSTCGDLALRASTAGLDGRLAACATSSCGAVCRAFEGTSETKCIEPSFGRGATCTCTPAPDAGNDFECSPETYPDTVCCAPSSWPATGLECTCRPLGCTATPQGCSCALVEVPPQHSECAASTCCVNTSYPDQCTCGRQCYDFERPVPTCSLAAFVNGAPAIGCKNGQIRVATCSIRKP